MLREVIDESPVEVFVHVTEMVALFWEDEHIEALACTDQCVDHTDGVARVHVVVDVAMNEEQVTLEVLGNAWVGLDLIYESSVAFGCYFLLDTMVSLAPPAVVDVVVVVACT